jgi:hypothetical protein
MLFLVGIIKTRKYEQNTEMLNVKTDGKYSYYCPLKG